MQRGARVIDVRSPEEYASGHLSKAINIPLDQLESRIGQVVTNKEQPLLLHCASGIRSGHGKRILNQLGYTEALNVGSYDRAAKMIDNPTNHFDNSRN
jgi:rhodanese-related sulfurtransferase